MLNGTHHLAMQFACYAAGKWHDPANPPNKPKPSSVQHMLIGFIPQSSVTARFTRCEKGYDGSASDYHFVSMPPTNCRMLPQIRCGHIMCACDACQARNCHGCLVQLVSAKSKDRMRTITAGRKPAVLRGGRVTSIAKFALQVKAEDMVVIRGGASESEEDEPFWLARVKKMPWKCEVQGFYGGDYIELGWLIVKVHYLYFVLIGPDGTYTWEKRKGSGEDTINLNTLVQGSKSYIADAKNGLRYDQGKRVYCLPGETVHRMHRFLDFSA